MNATTGLLELRNCDCNLSAAVLGVSPSSIPSSGANFIHASFGLLVDMRKNFASPFKQCKSQEIKCLEKRLDQKVTSCEFLFDILQSDQDQPELSTLLIAVSSFVLPAGILC